MISLSSYLQKSAPSFVPYRFLLALKTLLYAQTEATTVAATAEAEAELDTRIMEADWDLQAVVRGCATTISTVEDPFSCFAPFGQEQEDQLFCFPDLCETNTVIEELENMYKPFFPIFQPLTPPTIPTSISMSFGGLKEQQQQIQQQQQQKQKPQESLTGSASATTTTITHSQTRSKKRKNQQKKVVCQVPVEGLSSDMWAWRKYGQKPIKGSPYPRSYYKCSSSKGCPARKQVERSRSDPAMFIITYTAEHNHSVPTHRNSLAGSTRQKFSTTQGSSAAEKPSCSSSSPTLSPTTSLTPSMEDELLQETKLESREDEEEEEMVGLEQEDELLIPDMVITDDFFTGLEEFTGITSISATTTTTGGGATSPAFEDCFSDLFPANIPSVWLTNNAATAAGRS